ncbi:hypothetical protein [Paenibacillus lutrae]|uniref:Uncharacterized protein n=1 Tax=Paenibacillus lutrae TaxID=2078573 RepID=A0A7X3FM98_9BACL|nr:hypothetical protein [Paenibacillus lutrae]MVP02089.1 hypothetical protein [Paenibacillus lutrae]
MNNHIKNWINENQDLYDFIMEKASKLRKRYGYENIPEFVVQDFTRDIQREVVNYSTEGEEVLDNSVQKEIINLLNWRSLAEYYLEPLDPTQEEESVSVQEQETEEKESRLILAVAFLTGIPAKNLLLYEDYGLAGGIIRDWQDKRYYVEPREQYDEWEPELKKENKVIGEHEGLVVYCDECGQDNIKKRFQELYDYIFEESYKIRHMYTYDEIPEHVIVGFSEEVQEKFQDLNSLKIDWLTTTRYLLKPFITILPVESPNE